ncbi:uncharacterized protein F4812DRAFT_414636 [Daldinia caldariorum]|uniref:uncharacterized protein n=1 Tax=Daldinia caldariorum TaxID=326644 RepID=UPI002008C3DF|nr:uncharacterized protein F4812DRAFT_414636 [Daldinia caldariorum]KAI1471579.1 hypothetical protein F4812DRAFT_414636 [Daldinia caldariorum]
MQLTATFLFLAGLLASNAVAVPLAARQASSVNGQACTDGTFDGTCRADGRCGLEIPPNEVSFRFVEGQCGVAASDDNNGGAFGNFFGNKGNSNKGNSAVVDDEEDDEDDDELDDDSDTDDEGAGNQASRRLRTGNAS